MDSIEIMLLEREIETIKAILAIMIDSLLQKNIITEKEMEEIFDKDKVEKVKKQFKDVGGDK